MDYKSGSRTVDCRWQRLLLLGVTVIFFVSCLILIFDMPRLFVSPDALANYLFSSELAENSRLHLFEPMNLELDDSLYPRSTFSIQGRVLPVSFLGLPFLYGLIAKLVGIGGMLLITPILAGLAIFAWRGIVARLYNDRVALLSAILLAVHPAWWYYTARGMMHNVLFVSLLIFALWFLVVRPIKSKRFSPNLLVSGLLFGLALFVRTSEIVWLLPVAILVIGFFWKKLSWKPVVIFFVSILIALIPMFAINNSLYGSPTSFGYLSQIDSGAQTYDQPPSEQIETIVSEPVQSVLPFGFDFRAMVKHMIDYGFNMFWWISFLTVIGLLLAFYKIREPKTGRDRPRWAFHASFFLIGIALSILYGSWTFTDNPDPNSLTIANSYIRYWLPIFVMTTVYAGIALTWLREKMMYERTAKFTSLALLLIIVLLGFRTTFFTVDDGLYFIRTNLIRSAEIKETVLELTEEDSVIIVDRADKIFYPERLVRYPLRDDLTYELMPRIVIRAPLYYYGITFPESDIEYLNTKKLAEMDLQIELIQTFDQETLYRIYPQPVPDP